MVGTSGSINTQHATGRTQGSAGPPQTGREEGSYRTLQLTAMVVIKRGIPGLPGDFFREYGTLRNGKTLATLGLAIYKCH